MPEDNKYRKALRHRAKLESGGYGKKTKKPKIVAYEKFDKDGKKTTVGASYKDAEKKGFKPVYQKFGDVKGTGRKGKNVLVGAVAPKTPAERTKAPKQKAESSISKYKVLKDGETKLVAKKEQTPSGSAKTLAAKQEAAGKNMGVKVVNPNKPEKDFPEFKSNKEEAEKSKYVKGSQTKKQIVANRDARRKSKASGGEGTRKAYVYAKNKLKNKTR